MCRVFLLIWLEQIWIGRLGKWYIFGYCIRLNIFEACQSRIVYMYVEWHVNKYIDPIYDYK